MSDVKKCDRCNCLYGIYSGIKLQSKGVEYNSMYISNGCINRHYDLCENCMSSLIDWIKKGGVE